MAGSNEQVCNIALRRIQAQPITDLVTDDSKSAALCRTFYEEARDTLLSEATYPWAFSIVRQTLAVAAGTNMTSKTYMYQLPTDPYCLRPICLIDQMNYWYEYLEFPFTVEGNKLYTDLVSAGLKYVGRVTDPMLFSPGFTDVLAWRLAAEMIKPIEGSSPIDPWTMYEKTYREAMTANTHGQMEPGAPKVSIVDSRFG